MRILQLVTMRQRRGAEVFATQLADALAAHGHEVVVVGLFPPPADPLSPELATAEDLLVAQDGKLSLRRVRDVEALVRRLRPEVVQANGSQTLKYSSLAKRLSAHPFPLVYRNISMASRWLRSPAHRAWNRWLVRSFDHVTSVSDESSRDFGEVYRVPEQRRSVIRRGIRIPRRVQAEAARGRLEALAGIPPGSRVLVHTGSYSEEKNHAWLVETFQRVRVARPDAHLVLIGDGSLRPDVERQVERLGLREAVHVLGMRFDAAELVAGADLFVLPSRIEGIPGAVLEASAQAVPSVVTDVGGMREAVVDGHTGILISPGDRDGFVEGVLDLLTDEARRRAMGVAARTLVQERFSMDATAAAFEELYTRLVHEKRP
jgi:L-malate glycosyltransferase